MPMLNLNPQKRTWSRCTTNRTCNFSNASHVGHTENPPTDFDKTTSINPLA